MVLALSSGPHSAPPLQLWPLPLPLPEPPLMFVIFKFWFSQFCFAYINYLFFSLFIFELPDTILQLQILHRSEISQSQFWSFYFLCEVKFHMWDVRLKKRAVSATLFTLRLEGHHCLKLLDDWGKGVRDHSDLRGIMRCHRDYFSLRKAFSRMVMRAHHDKESEEEDEDSGHDELDVSAGDLMIKTNIVIYIDIIIIIIINNKICAGDRSLLLLLLLIFVQLHSRHYWRHLWLRSE